MRRIFSRQYFDDVADIFWSGSEIIIVKQTFFQFPKVFGTTRAFGSLYLL